MEDGMKTKIIAIDFDGTIVDHEFPRIGQLKEGVRDFMKALHKQGHKIIVWTCRQARIHSKMSLIQNDYF